MNRYSPTAQGSMVPDDDGNWVTVDTAVAFSELAERSIAHSQEECFDRLRAARALRLVFERLEGALGIELDDDVSLNELLDIVERRIRREVAS